MSVITEEYLNKLQAQYDKKLAVLEANYQDTGSASTQRSIYKYSDLIKIICLAREQIMGGCCSCDRHKRDVENLIKNYEAYERSGLKDFENFGHFISDLKSIRF